MFIQDNWLQEAFLDWLTSPPSIYKQWPCLYPHSIVYFSCLCSLLKSSSGKAQVLLTLHSQCAMSRHICGRKRRGKQELRTITQGNKSINNKRERKTNARREDRKHCRGLKRERPPPPHTWRFHRSWTAGFWIWRWGRMWDLEKFEITCAIGLPISWVIYLDGGHSVSLNPSRHLNLDAIIQILSLGSLKFSFVFSCL